MPKDFSSNTAKQSSRRKRIGKIKIMKIALSIVTIFLLFISLNAQSKTISKDEYEKVIDFAESKTNADYPVIFKVITTIIENSKTVSTETEIVENESEGRSRQKTTVFENGKETNKYQINAGFGSVYCSDDGIKWEGPSKYECGSANGGAIRIGSVSREPEISEYSVATKTVSGKKVKIYREYLVFAPFAEGEKKTFREEISTIDSRGFFITVEGVEGTLDPKTVALTRKQSWITKAKIKPVIAPIK